MTNVEFIRTLRNEWMERPVKISVLEGGISNENFLVEDDKRFYKVRIPGRIDGLDFFPYYSYYRDGEISDLKALEATNVVWNADTNPMGVIPGVVDYRNDSKIVIFSYVPGITSKTEDFTDPKIREDFIVSVKRVHNSCIKFTRTFNVFREVERYLNVLNRYRESGRITMDYPMKEFRTLAAAFERELDMDRIKPVPCHNDLLAGNIILSDFGAHIIDFDCGGMNDPRFELADFLVENTEAMTERNEDHILDLYFGGQKETMRRGVDYYKFMADYLWALWAAIYMNVSPVPFDYDTFARDRFNRMPKHIQTLKERYSIS